MIDSLVDIMRLIDTFTNELTRKGCSFDENGFPIMNPSHYLEETPKLIVPYANRNLSFVKDPTKTVLCFFCKDKEIYPRMERLHENLPTYSQYMAVAGFDVTVTQDMDLEWQREIMLLNQLATAILAFNDIKIVQNTRCGSRKTLECFKSVPKNVTCISGTLGCSQTKSQSSLSYSEKLMILRPSKVLLYGKRDPLMERQLTTLGIPYQQYLDVHSLYKQKKRNLGIIEYEAEEA